MNSQPLVVRDSIRIRASREEVFRAFWDAATWPGATPHVRQIEMLREEAEYQRFRMTISSGDQMLTMETERTATAGTGIAYRQLTPPPFLREHTGRWDFTERDGAVDVALEHRVIIEEEEAARHFASNDSWKVRARIRDALSRNGRTTMECLKARLEAHAAVS